MAVDADNDFKEGLSRWHLDAAAVRELWVLRARELPARLCIAYDDREASGETHRAAGERTAIQQDGVTGLPQRGGVLIQNAAVHAHEYVLSFLAQESEPHRLDAPAIQDAEQRGGCHLERCGRTEATPERYGAVNQTVEAVEGQSFCLQDVRHPADVVSPRHDPIVGNMLQAESSPALKIQ
jgi:hypothetical protein